MSKLLHVGWILALALTGCRSASSGACNICPNAASVNTASCSQQGTANHCSSASIQVLHDPSCNTGDAGYQACVFTDCDKAVDCNQVVTY